MSLEFEERGAECAECKHFVFLPNQCPRCNAFFCFAHLAQHHLSPSASIAIPHAAFVGTAAGEGKEKEGEPPWCVLAPDTIVPSTEAPLGVDSTHQLLVRDEQRPRCSVCHSDLCVLVPCPECLRNFCAEHRFHGHEDERSTGKQRHVPETRQMAHIPGELAPVVLATCAPYVTATPLKLAPPGYRSRMMPLLILVAQGEAITTHTCPASSSSSSAAATSVAVKGGGDEVADSSAMSVGICSVSVAVEATLGQMLQRCLAELKLPVLEVDPLFAAACAAARLYTLSAIRKGDVNVHASASKAGSIELVLASVELSAVTKVAVLPTTPMVLHIPTLAQLRSSDVHGKGTELDVEPVLMAAVRNLLFKSQGGGGRGMRGTDDRVRAVTTRLWLHASDTESHVALPLCLPEAPASMLSAGAEEPTATTPETLSAPSPLPSSLSCTSRATAIGSASDVWPMRVPPPLQDATFLNSKAAPNGMQQAGTGGRVTVAVFVADTALPRAVKPFCLALRRDWPPGRVLDRAREEAEAAAGGGGGGNAVVLKQYVLFLLSTPAAEPMRLLAESDFTTSPLKDGDVLFLGAQDEDSTALQREVDRLKEFKGKEQAALRMTMQKKCIVM